MSTNDPFLQIVCEHGQRGGSQFCIDCLRNVWDRASELREMMGYKKKKLRQLQKDADFRGAWKRLEHALDAVMRDRPQETGS